MGFVSNFTQGIHRRVDHKSCRFKKSKTELDAFRGRQWFTVSRQHGQVTTGKGKFLNGFRSSGCDRDCLLRGINRGLQRFPDAEQSDPKFMFKRGFPRTHDSRISERGLFLSVSAAFQRTRCPRNEAGKFFRPCQGDFQRIQNAGDSHEPMRRLAECSNRIVHGAQCLA